MHNETDKALQAANLCRTLFWEMQEQFLNGKVLIFKKRRRKNSRRLNGHRQVRRCVHMFDAVCDIEPGRLTILGAPSAVESSLQELMGLRITDIQGLDAA